MEALKALTRKLLGKRFLGFRRFIRLLLPDTRTALAIKYLSGSGLEIGALHQPLPVPYRVDVRYLDRLSLSDLRAHIPELKSYPMVDVDIVDDGERMEKVSPESQDFVIANHFLEHCENPAGAIENFLRVLKQQGLVYLSVPDKRFSFDSERPVTCTEHLIKDYREGPGCSRREHLLEWASLVDKKTGDEIEKHIQYLMSNDNRIHYHVWTIKEMSEFLDYLKSEMKMGFEILERVSAGKENIFILRKL